MKTQPQYHLLTLQALEKADAGQAIDHEAVVAWAKSLNAEQDILTSPTGRGQNRLQAVLGERGIFCNSQE